MWSRIRNSLVSGGVFAGDFMGLKDSWASNFRSTTLPLDVETLGEMFRDFEIVRLDECDEDAKTSLGKMKRWHTYSVVAIKS